MIFSLQVKVSRSLTNISGNFAVKTVQAVNHAQSIGLDLTFFRLKVGDGNCWYNAIVEQIHRASVFNIIPETLRFSDVGALRRSVVEYVRQNIETNCYIQQQKVSNFTAPNQWENFLTT